MICEGLDKTNHPHNLHLQLFHVIISVFCTWKFGSQIPKQNGGAKSVCEHLGKDGVMWFFLNEEAKQKFLEGINKKHSFTKSSLVKL